MKTQTNITSITLRITGGRNYDRLVELCRIARAMYPNVQVKNPFQRVATELDVERYAPGLSAEEQAAYKELFLELCDALARLNHVHRVEVKHRQWEVCREDVTNALSLIRKDVFPHSLLNPDVRALRDAILKEFGHDLTFNTAQVAYAFRMNRRTVQRHMNALVQARYVKIVGGSRYNPGFVYQLTEFEQ
jgi:hypothetical protein